MYRIATKYKKSSFLLLCLMIIFMLASCGSNEGTPANNEDKSLGENTPAIEGLKEPIAELPVLLTSAGQSADVEMVKVMMERGEITPTVNSSATSADLADYKTLVIAVGGSSKGLGAAGIDADQELKRVQELIDAADEQGLTIIALHVGGSSRRGELSDKFIAPSFAKSDYAIVVAEGNKDGLMTQLATDAGIPMDEVATMADVVAPLAAAFK